MAKRVLHPALKARAAAVKVAHAHLKANVAGFSQQLPHEQFKAVQAHLKKGGGGC